MFLYTKEYEPVRRRLRIQNKRRLVIFLLIILCTLCTLIIHKSASSQTVYRPYTVSFGDTYWDIAKQLQSSGYKPRRDIREVVYEIEKLSGIPAHKLKAGDTILIPELGE